MKNEKEKIIKSYLGNIISEAESARFPCRKPIISVNVLLTNLT